MNICKYLKKVKVQMSNSKYRFMYTRRSYVILKYGHSQPITCWGRRPQLGWKVLDVSRSEYSGTLRSSAGSILFLQYPIQAIHDTQPHNTRVYTDIIQYLDVPPTESPCKLYTIYQESLFVDFVWRVCWEFIKSGIGSCLKLNIGYLSVSRASYPLPWINKLGLYYITCTQAGR